MELPFELTPAQRLQLAEDFCHDRFVAGRDCPIPHWCVIHAPDEHNDARNVHMHIVFAERPAKRMINPATGKEVWDFGEYGLLRGLVMAARGCIALGPRGH